MNRKMRYCLIIENDDGIFVESAPSLKTALDRRKQLKADNPGWIVRIDIK